MFCTRCGIELRDQDRFCSQCGTASGSGFSAPPRTERLSRPMQEAKIAGVCAGVARYFDVDVTLVRILWLVVTVYPPGVGLLAYIICWIAMPKDPLPVSSAVNVVKAI